MSDCLNRLPARFGGPFRVLAAALLCLSLLAACENISRQELLSLGSKLDQQSVNFADLEAYAKRSKAAYASEATIRASYPKTIHVATPGKTNVVYFLERDDAAKTQYLTVRGTANKANIIEDLDVSVREDRQVDIPIHTGFDSDAHAVYTDAVPYLKKGYRTNITGHSLGGAVAAIIGIYAIEDGFQIDKIVTFGQPRFTTAKGVGRLGFLPLLRVVDENDVIPMVPPATVLDKTYGPYEHVGPEVILLDGPHYVYLANHDANRIDIGEFWRSIGIADLKDHKIDRYVVRIADKISGATQVTYNQREKYTSKN